MPDLTTKTMSRLKVHRIRGLSLEGDIIFPDYEGYSLLNLPSSICRLLEVPAFGAAPLAPEILADVSGPYRQVVLLVLDGLGFDRFLRYIDREDSVWKRLLGAGALAPITSVTPSTTSTALTTLWTGRSPAEHGVVGYEVWLQEYGIVANMIVHSAASSQGDAGGLSRSGFNPEDFLPAPTFGPHLRRYGVQPHAFMPAALVRSGLSAMHLQKVTTYPYRSISDLWISLADLLQNRQAEKVYTYAYWPELDTLAHVFGPDNERVEAEFLLFSQAFEQIFLQRLGADGLKNTLLLVTADHGLVTTPHNPVYELRRHPQLNRMLHIQPTGENRLAYLYSRPGAQTELEAYFAQAWPGQFSLVESEQALRAGLFGPGVPAPQTANRIGETLALAQGQAYLWWAAKENHMIGRHGGLSPQEMLVPLLAIPI